MSRPEILFTVISLFISTVVATIQFRDWWTDKESKRKAEILSQAHSEQNRDEIIVGSAERAVGILEKTLKEVNAETDRLRRELDQARVEIAALRLEIADYRREYGSITPTRKER